MKDVWCKYFVYKCWYISVIIKYFFPVESRFDCLYMNEGESVCVCVKTSSNEIQSVQF